MYEKKLKTILVAASSVQNFFKQPYINQTFIEFSENITVIEIRYRGTFLNSPYIIHVYPFELLCRDSRESYQNMNALEMIIPICFASLNSD